MLRIMSSVTVVVVSLTFIGASDHSVARADLTASFTLNGSTIYSDTGNPGKTFAFFHNMDDGVPNTTDWFYQGRWVTKNYPYMGYEFGAATSDINNITPSGNNIEMKASYSDTFQYVWTGPGVAPAIPNSITVQSVVHGVYSILNDGSGLNGNGSSGSFQFDVSVDSQAYSPIVPFDHMPGIHPLNVSDIRTVQTNGNSTVSIGYDVAFVDTYHNTNIEGDFLTNTVGITSILLPDGSTPESQGWRLDFASGMQSPNLSDVPEPSMFILWSLAGLAAIGIMLRHTKNAK